MKLQYLTRVPTGLLVSYNSVNEVINSYPIKFINSLCIEYLSTYNGRRIAVIKKYGFKKLTPLYVNEHILLFPTGSSRDFDTLWVNYHEIQHVYSDYIVMNNDEKLVVKASIIDKQLKNCFEIAF